MFSRKRRFGNAGEELAAEFLKAKGYRILSRACRVGRLGELDLITEKGSILVFVEVKTRHDASFGEPEEALTPTKRRHLRRAIQGWLMGKGLDGIRHRVDVVAVDHSTVPPSIRHLEGVQL